MARPPGPITEVINQYLRDHGIKVADIKLEKIDKIAKAIARFSVRSGKQFGLKDIRRKLGLMRSHAIQKNKTASVSKIASTPSPVVDAPKKATPAPPVGAYLGPQVTIPLLSNYTAAEIYVTAERIHQVAAERARAILDAAAEQLRNAGCDFKLEQTEGDPAETIANRATELDCESITMGTHGLSSFGILFMGSVAQRVVHYATVPVTLVK